MTVVLGILVCVAWTAIAALVMGRPRTWEEIQRKRLSRLPLPPRIPKGAVRR